MLIMSFARRWLLAAPLLLAAAPALAQSPAPPPINNSNVNFGGMLEKARPAPAAPDVPAPPMAWPRLDRGAVLCQTEDDLLRRAAILRGEPTDPANCRPITAPTAVQIIQRAGPGSTEVKLTARNETGWTDAWLPPTPPPGTAPIQAGRLPGSASFSSQ